jgi:riboflavin kinase/FMN adenylyltransferase
MKGAWRGLEAIPADFGPSAVTIGNFDGVHLGHRKILSAAAAFARRDGMSSVALTFDPHPLEVVAPALAPKTLTSLRQRVRLIRQQGIDYVAILPFTAQLSQLSPHQFAERVLADRLAARKVVVGANFRFGCGQAGDAAELGRLGQELGFEVELAGTVLVGGAVVSSTRVRSLVRQGRVVEARRLLGREFSLHGPIVRGEGIGTKQTVPTLNLAPESQVLPADGVYVTATRQAGQAACHESVTNVGMRPTFNGRQRTIETFLLGRFAAKAPEAIELKFLRKIRDERKFPSAKSLREQIQVDIEVATRFFRRLRAVSTDSP